MKKLFKITILSLVVIFLLSACKPKLGMEGAYNLDTTPKESESAKEGTEMVQQSDSPYQPENRIYLDESEWIIIKSEKTGIKKAGGIWVNEKSIVVSDRENNKLIVLDKDGNKIQEVGKIGMGPLEFSAPTDIFYNEQNKLVYVLDAGNHRVQVLSESLEYIKEISLKGMEVSNSTSYSSIAADLDSIYVALDMAYEENLKLYRISKDGKVEKSKEACSGVLFADSTGLYVAQTIDHKFAKSEIGADQFDVQGFSGQTYLYKVMGAEVEKIANIPFMYTPGDVIKKNDTYYIVSTLWSMVETFILEGQEFVYQETITPQVPSGKTSSNEGYFLSLFDDTLYMANGTYGDIYVIPIA